MDQVPVLNIKQMSSEDIEAVRDNLKKGLKHKKVNEGSLKMSRRLVSSSIDVWLVGAAQLLIEKRHG